jgi:hypothetical protein
MGNTFVLKLRAIPGNSFLLKLPPICKTRTTKLYQVRMMIQTYYICVMKLSVATLTFLNLVSRGTEVSVQAI